MRFRKRYRELYLACDRDENRPVLGNIRIEAAGDDEATAVAVACNGYLLVVVPVTLADGDVAGLIPWEAWKAARPDRDGECAVYLHRDHALTASGQHGRPKATEGRGQFPNWRNLLTYTPPEGRCRDDLTVNPRLVGLVGRALGVGADDGLVVSWGASKAGVTLWHSATDRTPERPFEPPFALLMPMVVTR